MKDIICQNCGKNFLTKYSKWHEKNGRKKYCSKECNTAKYLKTRINKSCLACGKNFEIVLSRKNRAKYCSKACQLFGSIGVNGYWNGKKRPKEKMGNAVKTMFKPTGLTFNGTKNEYHNLHDRIRRKLGKALKCSQCGSTEGIIDWANKSRLYKESNEDWFSLCRKCHWYYDQGGNAYV